MTGSIATDFLVTFSGRFRDRFGTCFGDDAEAELAPHMRWRFGAYPSTHDDDS